MAVYFLRCKHVSRAKGARVTRAAAYRAGERIRDERSSEVYDHCARHDVAYKEVVLPKELAGNPDMAWTQDRAILWNAAEHAGLRCNSRLAREWLVFLPPELAPEGRAQLVRKFASELADRFGSAVDVCVHAPRPGADPRNHHAHLLMTTREVTPLGMGRRTSLELGGRERRQAGIAGTSRQDYLGLRERWAGLTNEALRDAGLSARVDHRSLKSQGINREPTPTIPEKVFYAERHSQTPNAAGDEIRTRHRERVLARREGSDELARVQAKQDAALKARAREELSARRARAGPTRWGAMTRDERNEKRREYYLVRRAREKLDSAGEAKRRKAARDAARSRWQRDPEAARRARREWRKANSQEVNQKQREYRQKNAEVITRKRREHWRANPEEARQKQRDYRERNSQHDPLPKSTTPTAEQSARNWKLYRETHGPGPTAEESAWNWLALRERQSAQESAKSSASEKRERQGSSKDEADDDPPRSKRDHDYDL